MRYEVLNVSQSLTIGFIGFYRKSYSLTINLSIYFDNVIKTIRFASEIAIFLKTTLSLTAFWLIFQLLRKTVTI